MDFKLDLEEIENLEHQSFAIDELKALDMEGTTGATEGAASVGSSMPIPPYFWFTCSA